MSKIAVKQAPEKEIPTEVMAESIVTISAGIKKLLSGRLNDKALWLLIQHSAPGQVSQRDIKAVLEPPWGGFFFAPNPLLRSEASSRSCSANKAHCEYISTVSPQIKPKRYC